MKDNREKRHERGRKRGRERGKGREKGREKERAKGREMFTQWYTRPEPKSNERRLVWKGCGHSFSKGGGSNSCKGAEEVREREKLAEHRVSLWIAWIYLPEESRQVCLWNIPHLSGISKSKIYRWHRELPDDWLGICWNVIIKINCDCSSKSTQWMCWLGLLTSYLLGQSQMSSVDVLCEFFFFIIQTFYSCPLNTVFRMETYM